MSEQAAIRYRVQILDAHAHLFRVVVEIPDPHPHGQEFRFPAWTPGSYLIREYSRHMVQIGLRAGQQSLALTHNQKNHWQAPATDHALTLTYDIYAWDRSVRGCHLDQNHGFINGAALFMQVSGMEAAPCTAEFMRPKSSFAKQWKLATAMTSVALDNDGFGLYQCRDFDELIDHPVEMGDFAQFEFSVRDVPHYLVLSGPCQGDFKRVCEDLGKICEQHASLFATDLPMRHYYFLTQVVEEGYGGLEHRDSSAILCSRGDFPAPSDKKMSDSYIRFLGLMSHEYFHLWNVKRIKPVNFFSYDLGQETDTQLLWIFEGFTSYYDDLTLVRSGVITIEQYLELLAQSLTRVYRGRGRLKQTVTDSAKDAWTKFYRQDENAPNAIVSYYTKGALIALALDLIIRQETENAKSLDDVMRALWQCHGRPSVGVEPQQVEALISEVSGLSLTEFFQTALRSTEDLPLALLLESVGVQFHYSAAQAAKPKGGFLTSVAQDTAEMSLGVTLSPELNVAEVQQVYEDGLAHQTGIAAGDQLVALAGYRITRENLSTLLNRHEYGAKVNLHYFRDGYLNVTEIEVLPPKANTIYLSLAAEASEQAIKRRMEWLNVAESP